MQLTEIFYEIDGFCKQFEKQTQKRFLSDGQNKRNRSFQLTLSEVMTIMVCYHESGYKTFKDFYEKHVLIYMKADFHPLVSYNRFFRIETKCAYSIAYFPPAQRHKALHRHFIHRQFSAESLPC